MSRLQERQQKGPPELGLDVYIVEIEEILPHLKGHVAGKVIADAARTALLATLDSADDNVDTWMRHLFGFLDTEGLRRTGPHAARARALRDVAFPSGLNPIDQHVIDENIYCRAAVEALRSPEHQDTVVAIGLPVAWINTFEVAVKASDAIVDELMKARGDKSAHVELGRDVEVRWVDIMTRLRRYVGSRAKKGETAKQVEGRQLLEPLLTALQKLRIEAALRAAQKKKATPEAPAPAAPEAPEAPDAREAAESPAKPA